MLDQEQLAEQQAQLNKNLAAAILNHQIHKLEDQHRAQEASQAQGEKKGQGDIDQSKAGKVEPKKQVHRIDDNASGAGGARRFEDDERGFMDDEFDDEDEDWRVVVVDASALMWAAQGVRDLVAKGFEVIVPSNGLITLDLLKKGNSPYAQAARSAARFIEHAQRQHALLSIDPSITVQLGTDYKRGKGLRIQREDETRPADELSSLPLMPGEEGPPKWVQSVLGCAAYFMGINKAELDNSFHNGDADIKSTLYVASPPTEILIAQDPTSVNPRTREMRDQAERNGSYHERGEGVVILEEAERFEISIEVLRVEDDTIPGMRNSVHQGQRNRGRTPAGNGHGHGNGQMNGGGRPQGRPRKKEEEKEPGVKILLKRPQPQPQPLPVDSQPPGLSNEHTSGPDASGTTESSDDIVRSLLMPDLPPPAGLVGGLSSLTVDEAGSFDMARTKSINSVLSNQISPPAPQRKLHIIRKSPPSKFVPLTRETHPVRRQADDESSDSGDSQKERHGHGGGRGRGRGGRGGRGGPGRADGGGGRRRKDRSRDDEFKNGNFTLLQRPQPPPQTQSPMPAPASSSVPAPAVRPAVRPARKPPASATQPRPAQAPATPVAPPVRAILQRPPRAPAAMNGHANGNGLRPTRPIARDMQTSWRSKGVPPRPPPPPTALATPNAPVPALAPIRPQVPSAPSILSAGLSAKAPVFEFDEKMLSPGYGSTAPIATSQANGSAEFATNGYARGHHHARGRGGFGPGPKAHHHNQHQHRPPPGPGPGTGHHHHHPHHHQLPDRAPVPSTPPQWQPAPQSAKPIILQRPT